MPEALPAADAGAAGRDATKGSAPGGLVLCVLLSAMFIVQFDFFVVNVAAPSLERDLHASGGMLELVVGGYAFAFASGMITGGRLGDLYGHRRLFVTGMAAFAIASLLCGVTVTAGQLVAARLVQGAAGALMVPQVLAVITAHFPAASKPRAIAGYGMASGLGSIAGQVLGGALLETHLFVPGWRLIFLINVPVCAVAAVLAARQLPAPVPGGKAGLDPAGAVGVCLALVLVLLPLSLGRTSGWPAWSWICMVAAAPVAVGTLLWERALTRRSGSPVLDLTLFRSASFSSGMIAGIAFQLYFGSFMFTLTLLLQSGLGLGPLTAGLTFAPMGVLFGVSSLLGRRFMDRYGMKVLLAGSATTGAGLLALTLLLHASGAAVGVPWVVLCLCLIGFGNGLVLPALIGAALVQVRPRKAGAASGVLTTSQQFANSAGVAVVGATFFAMLGASPTASDYAHAMTVSALIDLALVAAVLSMCVLIKRRTEAAGVAGA
ncbi:MULTISPECIES: MFS transporter [unclassified Streptomyces]|uniref:MFS transporter n=1 Tax=unclassified Streptomyces TaxID=2593676 RepID=UPI0033DA2E7E